MDLLKYKLYVSHCLMEMKPKSDHQQKTGRQSSTCASSSPYKWKTAEERPVNEVQNDGVQYLPKVYDKKKASHCKNPGCKGRSHVYCAKCNTHMFTFK